MKKIFALLISIAILSSALPVESKQVLAATNVDAVTEATPVASEEITSKTTEAKATEVTATELDRALNAVKKLIEIPKDYSDFDYYYNPSNIYTNAYWAFTWRNPNSYANIYVSCDEKYRITSYSKYDHSIEGRGIAKYLKDELKSSADAFIKKVAPDIMSSIKFIDAEYDSIYSGNYIYNYQRRNNGVDFPDNNLSVAVSSVTGEVSYLYINWLYDEEVPSGQAKITKEKASEIIHNNMKMKLVYRSYNDYTYDKNDDTKTKAYLVYVPTQDYISVDAKSGEVYHNMNQWIGSSLAKTGSTKEEAAAMDMGGSNSNVLTEEEIAKIDELKNMISKSDAIKKITGNKALYMEDTLTSYNAVLQKSWDAGNKSVYVWNIEFNDPRIIDYSVDTDTYRAYAYASVDAKTGKILQFDSTVKSNYDIAKDKWKTVKITYDKEKGKEVFEKFAKAQIPDRFKNSVLANEANDYIAYYTKEESPVYGGYNYQYHRVNEGVEYPYNSIYGSVDGVSGKIYSYGSYWDSNIEFEATKGVISAEDAMKAYLNLDGFGLKYEINQINQMNYDASYNEKAKVYYAAGLYDQLELLKTDYEIRLVYRPDIYPSSISPFTGKQLDYNGKEYTVRKPYEYKDIDNSSKNRNILLLADMNIGFEGENFLPDQKITLGEINTLISNIGYSRSEVSDSDNNFITREDFASLLINKLGLEKLADLKGIYTTGYGDEASISKKNIGAVALVKGLGIMGGDSNNYFNPQSNISRYEAIDYILNYVNVQQKGLYY